MYIYIHMKVYVYVFTDMYVWVFCVVVFFKIPAKEALHAIDITGQVTIQLLVTRLAPSSQWNTGDENCFDRILFSLLSKLCLPHLV